jgi:uncharacterized membrane protein (UPF0182 family)
MSESLRAHIRYPQDYFEIQAHLFALYHMKEQQIFYNREDEWEVPSINRRRMNPYYMVMKLPGEETEEFILMLPFTPKNKPNLSAWLVARSDGEKYGRLRVYSFPKDKIIYGPEQINARINQDDVISEKTTLWGQKGSGVVNGTLLVVPIEQSLIYVQPLYLQAESGSIPELKRIIVAYENEIAMEPTLEAALAKIFGLQSRFSGDDEVEMGSSTTTSIGWTDLVGVINSHYQSAEMSAREGDWAGYGEQTKGLGQAIEKLRRLADENNPATETDAPLATEDPANSLESGE